MSPPASAPTSSQNGRHIGRPLRHETPETKQSLQRKNLRLTNYNYSQSGYYFITICVNKLKCSLGKIIDGKNIFSFEGIIARKWLFELEKKFVNVKIDEYVVMPNHIHFILITDNDDKHATQALPSVMQWFKTMTTNEYIQLIKKGIAKKFDKKFWQRGYYEHVIRDDNSLLKIQNYIQTNPQKWHLDKLYQ